MIAARVMYRQFARKRSPSVEVAASSYICQCPAKDLWYFIRLTYVGIKHTLLDANFKYFLARSKFPEMFVLSGIFRSLEHMEPCLNVSSLLIDVALFGSLERH
jgi:hypothetical protein